MNKTIKQKKINDIGTIVPLMTIKIPEPDFSKEAIGYYVPKNNDEKATAQLGKFSGNYEREIVPPMKTEIPEPDFSKRSSGHYVPKNNDEKATAQLGKFSGNYEKKIVPPIKNKISE